MTVPRLNSLNQLFKTAVSSLPLVGNIFSLWLVFFLMWAIMDLEVFGLTKWGTQGEQTRVVHPAFEPY
jgi:hypothetical protein